MRFFNLDFREFFHRQKARIFVYSLCLLLLIAGGIGVGYARHHAAINQQNAETLQKELTLQHEAIQKFQTLQQQATTDGNEGINTSAVMAQYAKIHADILASNYTQAVQLIVAQTTSLTALVTAKQTADAAAEAKKGTLSGTVTDGTSPLAGATVNLVSAGQVTNTTTTDTNGTYSFKVDAATYTLTATLANYTDYSVDGVVITAQQIATKDIAMAVVPPPTPTPTPTPTATPKVTPKPTPKPTPTPTPSTSDSTAYSTYSKTTVNGFSVTMMTFDLGSGHIKVMEDTANDDDCTNNCSVQSVLSFVQQDGGFAGINGSYFCPTAYASCAGQTNSFYWKQYNSRLQKMINPSNNDGEQDPFLVFDASGHATFLRHWKDYFTAGVNLYAGISCAPILVYGGQDVVDDSTLDSEQTTTHATRGAIGLKGQTLYVVDVGGATIDDLGNVMESLGMDAAMNIDGGGSVGMVYKNAYKLGPGRNVPNALIFAEQ